MDSKVLSGLFSVVEVLRPELGGTLNLKQRDLPCKVDGAKIGSVERSSSDWHCGSWLLRCAVQDRALSRQASLLAAARRVTASGRADEVSLFVQEWVSRYVTSHRPGCVYWSYRVHRCIGL